MHRSIALVCVTAMVVSGATATAATLIDSDDVKNNSLQSEDIKNRDIRGGDIERGTLSLSLLKDTTVQELIDRTKAGLQLPGANTPGNQGENGAQGAQGAQGPQGNPGSNGAAGANGANGTDGANPATPVLKAGDSGWNQSTGTNAEIQGGELYFAGDAKQGLKKTYADQPSACTELSALSYSFRVDNRSAASKIAPAVKLEVVGANRIPANATGFTTLVFEPTYQPGRDTPATSREGSVNTMAPGNRWWSSNAIEGAPNRDTFVSFETLCNQNPDMKVTSVLFEAGSGSGADFAAGGDNLLIGFGDTFERYDFGG